MTTAHIEIRSDDGFTDPHQTVLYFCGHSEEKELVTKKNGKSWTPSGRAFWVKKMLTEGECLDCWKVSSSKRIADEYSKPTVTVLFTCGHESTVELATKKDGTPWTPAGRKWYVEEREETRECLNCWKEANPLPPRIDFEEVEKKMFWEEVEVCGTEKQVFAARLIRAELFMFVDDSGSLDYLDRSPEFEQAGALAGDSDSAKWWLENREALKAAENFTDLAFLIAAGVDDGSAVTCENPL